MYRRYRALVGAVRVVGEFLLVCTLGGMGIVLMIALMGIIAGCQPVGQ